MRVHLMAGTLLLLLAVAVLAAPVTAEEYVMVDKWGSEGSDEGQFLYSTGVAVDTAGNVYVADSLNNRIQKFDSSGNFLMMWGSSGTGDGQFQDPEGMAVDTSGNIYVADTHNHCIQKFDSDGNFITTWGSSGSGDGQFVFPPGVAVDTAGNVYVVDHLNGRVQKFDSDGNFIMKWGTRGSGDGQFNEPYDVAADTFGNVYVTDRNNCRIQKFDSSGVFLAKWGTLGSGDGQFASMGQREIAVDVSGNVYVVDCNNHRVQKFGSDGTFLTKWGTFGTGNGQFQNPHGIAVDTTGNVYVADGNNHRIQKFAPIPIPTITGIAPNSSTNNGPVSITDLSGTGFIDGATVKLTRAEEADIVATNVSVLSSTQITCTLDLTGAAVGPWNVMVTNPDERYDILSDGFAVVAASEVIPFNDPNLEAAVREALGKPVGDITADDMAELTGLDLRNRGISDLSGLEYAVNLQVLYLPNNHVSDFSPLANLTNLWDLDLAGNQISDLSPLANLTNAKTLWLHYNQIRDISPLVANTGLGLGDGVLLRYNYLDLTPGSAAMNDILALQSRGVHVYYDPQNPVPTYYTLDLTVNPDGSGTVTGAGTYAAGATVSITAKPNEGWVFANWTNMTGTPVSSEPDFNYTMPAQNTALIANFEPAPPVLTRIDVSPAEATLDVGATRQFTATGYDQHGNPMPAGEIVWSSTNTLVGTIDATGLFTATAEGFTTVTATAGEVSGTAEVIVTPALTVTGITPASGPNTGPVSITDLSGTGFVDGATVKLTRAGEPDIIATDVSVVSPTQITCTLDLTGAAVGPWNVMVTNPSNQSATLTDGFTVNAGNRAPIAEDDTYTTDEDTLLTVAAPGVLENDDDPDGDTLTASLVASTTNGTLALNPDGSFAYTPEAGWSGIDTFTYAANDSALDSNVATVTITVNPVNEAPTAADDTYTTDEGSTLSVDAPGVLENDDDPDGDTLTATLVTGTTNGTLTLNPDGSFTYTPDADFAGTDSFTYTANDGTLASNIATVTITVNPVNKPPTAG